MNDGVGTMKIGIIGGGSIGLLFAGYLAESHDVTIFTRTEHQANEINKKGITIEKKNNVKTFNVQAKISSSSVKEMDLLFIAVKQYILTDLLTQLKDIEKVGMICFLQNGMGHIEHIKQLQNATILVGIVEHGALKVDNTTVIHTGIGQTKIGTYKGNVPVLENIHTDFPIEFHDDWFDILSNKLVVNAVINPLTALYRVKNGELLENSYFHKQMKNVFRDIVSIIPTNEEKMWELVTTICKNTASNKSSMLRDIEEGRKTEIDAILGYILIEAKKRKRELTITQFLYDSLKGIEYKGG